MPGPTDSNQLPPRRESQEAFGQTDDPRGPGQMIDLRVLSLATLTLALLAACSGRSGPALPRTISTADAPSPTPASSPLATDTHPTVPSATPVPTEAASAESSPSTSERPLLMAHYMPWYQAPSVHGYWGWHWTMDHFHPSRVDENDRREIASHTYPLTGPYDSSDPDLLEVQVLLMKLSGIDGVIVDWYGIEPFWDYGTINDSTHALFEAVKKAGLRFAICYEDRTIGHMVDNGRLGEDEVYSHGQEVMRYLQQAWFGDPAYLRLAGRPVLLTFGPQYFKSSSDWAKLFAVLDAPPLFFTLDERLGSVAAGAFPWPPMWASRDGILTQEVLEDYLNQFYDRTKSSEVRIAGAFPGFHDIYAEAGVGDSYGYLDAQGDATLESTLRSALESHPNVVQLVTWNDYGEGTQIEPTVENGYRYLEIVQGARASIDPAFSFTAQDLPIPMRLFNLRKTHPDDPQVNAALDRAFSLIVRGEIAPAVALLDGLNDSIEKPDR